MIDIGLLGVSAQTSPRRTDVQYVRTSLQLASRGAPEGVLLQLDSFRLIRSDGGGGESRPVSNGPPSCDGVLLPANGAANCDVWFEVPPEPGAVSVRFRFAGHSVVTPSFALPRAEAPDPPLALTIMNVSVATARPDIFVFEGVRFTSPGKRRVEFDVTLANRDVLGSVARTEYFTLGAGGMTFPAQAAAVSGRACDAYFNDIPALGSYTCGLAFEFDADASSPRVVFDDGAIHADAEVPLPLWPEPDPSGAWAVTFESPEGPTTCEARIGFRIATEASTLFLAGTCDVLGAGYRLQQTGAFAPAGGGTTLSGSDLPACGGPFSPGASMTIRLADDGQGFTGAFDCPGGTTGTVSGVRSTG